MIDWLFLSIQYSKKQEHPLTDMGIEGFLKDWEAVKNG